MSSSKYTRLPMHRNTKPDDGALEKLNSALERGLDLAGLKSTKTGAGDKDKAYIVRSYTVLFCLLFSTMIIFVLTMAGVAYYMDLKVVKRESYHQFYLNHLSFQKAQHKLIKLDLELQKAVESQIHGTEQIEEFRSYADLIFGELRQNLKSTVVEEEAALVEKTVLETEEKLIRRLDQLIRFSSRQKKANEKRFKELSKSILDDINLSDIELTRFKEKLSLFRSVKTKVTDKEKEILQLGDVVKDTNDFGHIDEEDAIELSKNLEDFFDKFSTLEFPLVQPNMIRLWEKRLHQVRKDIADENTATDLKLLKKFLTKQFSLLSINLDPSLENGSLVDTLEKAIYKAKMVAHKQELLDLYEGYKAHKISAYKVLANIEEVANVEEIDIFEIFH